MGKRSTSNYLTLHENHVTIHLFQELPHQFPEKKPTTLPPLREPAEIMQYRIELISGATWSVRDCKQSYNRFQPEFTEKINSELISRRIVPNKSTQYITMFTKAKADKPEPMFLLDCVPVMDYDR